jgi:glycerophosphoryl diester phosphodiesterase
MDGWPHPLVIAHRGASHHAPENTLSAFSAAIHQGAHAIELDAKLSADGQVVVIHDATVNRTTDGKGRVANLQLTALRELDAGSFFSEEYRGEKIPTLIEVFEMVAGKRMLVNVELTNYTTPKDDLVKQVCGLISRFGMEKSVLLSSFLPTNLTEARSLLPDTPQGFLAWRGWMGWWSRSFGFNFGEYQALHCNLKDVNIRQVARVHRLHRRLYVWTVNTLKDMRRLFDWGVDGVFTDDPPLAFEAIKAKS